MTFWGANTEVVIADLSMDGYSISDVNCLNGSIVGGTVSSNGYILNCHAKGSISRLTAKGTWIYGGGIVGGMKMPNNQIGKYEGNTTIYRCSANTEFTIVDNTVPAGNSFGFGGIIGVNDYRCNTFIYDCYANSIYSADVAHNGVKLNGIFVGGIAGECIVGSIQGLGGTTYISGCVSKLINDFSTNPPIAWYNGGVASFHENPNATASSIATVENCYVSGTTKWIDTKNTAAKTLPWIFKNSNSTDPSISNKKGGFINGVGDIYYTGEDSDYGLANFPGMSLGNLATGCNTGTLLGTATTNGDTQLWTTAKNSSKLKSKIWKQKANIGSAYSIQNSPVINKFDTNTFKITYKDAHTDGTDTEIDTGTYNYGSTPGLKSQTNKTGKTFLGYTFDRTSVANPFKTLPTPASGSNYYGNIDLYAVWDVADADVTKDITVSGGKDESGTIVADYGEVIMLTADINCESMGSDITLEYEWRQGANVIATGENLSLTNVSDSGTYTLYYKIKSKT